MSYISKQAHHKKIDYVCIIKIVIFLMPVTGWDFSIISSDRSYNVNNIIMVEF